MTNLSRQHGPDFWQALSDSAYALDGGDVLPLDAIDAVRQAYQPPADDNAAAVARFLTMLDIELRRRVHRHFVEHERATREDIAKLLGGQGADQRNRDAYADLSDWVEDLQGEKVRLTVEAEAAGF
jgi:hypothetical protein